ncbi:hypothetical protein ANN_28248 [Periplaneta americana]|uniref:Uncharacterized protein n=1 Tax=Periplaneta americana TaxID=6978 RepID=A0ABQ8RUH9_PERAM|nr:hypothetical protein ANN_28248 [Periplaneta americana]
MIDKAVDRFVISLDSDSDDDDGDDNMEVEVEESATAHTNIFIEGDCLLPPSPPQSSGQPLRQRRRWNRVEGSTQRALRLTDFRSGRVTSITDESNRANSRLTDSIEGVLRRGFG